jgi:hypothetical protein
MYEHEIISPADSEFTATVNRWCKKSWEIIYMRRATHRVKPYKHESFEVDTILYELVLKKRQFRGHSTVL